MLYETMEEATVDYLKTRWYENTYMEAKYIILTYLKEHKGFTTNINDEYQEILFNIYFKEVFLKATSINGLIAIDIRVNGSIFSNNKKFINGFYDYLNSKLNFKGLSLMAGR